MKNTLIAISILTLEDPSCDIFRRPRRLRTLRQICGKLEGLPGPKSREKRSTLSGRKSGKSSRTSMFAYLEGNIAAKGVSSFFSVAGLGDGSAVDAFCVPSSSELRPAPCAPLVPSVLLNS